MKIRIWRDNFFITQRLQDIDGGYYLVYDTKKEKFELHNSSQLFVSYCLTFPFKEVDERMLVYARRTRAERQEKWIREIEAENQEIQKSQRDIVINKLMSELKY